VTRIALLAAAVILVLAGCGGSPVAAQPTPSTRTPGPLGDTWTWDGAGWHQVAVNGPTPRYLAALAYDSDHQSYVLFGGHTATGISDETWTWDGKSWKQLNPVHRPPPRMNAAMAYDPAHQVVVLYGGLIPNQNEGIEVGDTWTWDGSDWTEVDARPGEPGNRQGPRAVTTADGLILVGGHMGNIKYYGDAWTWNGKKWSRVDRAPTPPGRGAAAVVWNPVDSSLFVFSGTGFKPGAGPGNLGELLSDAWVLKDGAWTQLKGSGPPPVANSSGMWDSQTKRALVMLGMPCPNPSGDAWAWDGASWSAAPKPGMSARWGAAVAQAPDGSAVLLGGSDEAGC
jgi:hypothetical protein